MWDGMARPWAYDERIERFLLWWHLHGRMGPKWNEMVFDIFLAGDLASSGVKARLGVWSFAYISRDESVCSINAWALLCIAVAGEALGRKVSRPGCVYLRHTRYFTMISSSSYLCMVVIYRSKWILVDVDGFRQRWWEEKNCERVRAWGGMWRGDSPLWGWGVEGKVNRETMLQSRTNENEKRISSCKWSSLFIYWFLVWISDFCLFVIPGCFVLTRVCRASWLLVL